MRLSTLYLKFFEIQYSLLNDSKRHASDSLKTLHTPTKNKKEEENICYLH